MITSAIIVPHPPLILPAVGKGEERGIQKTIDAYRKASAFLAAAKPETVVILSPHAPMFADWMDISNGGAASGIFARFGAPQLEFKVRYDTGLAAEITALATDRGIPAGPTGQGDPALDHATMIPLYFLNEALSDYKVVRVGLSGLPYQAHWDLGRCIADAAGDKRVAIIASGDLSHRLTEDGPYGYRPEGPRLDAAITAALAAGDFAALMDIDPKLADSGAECGLRAFIMLGGALAGSNAKAELLSYEGPFGVGYAVATFAPGGADAPCAEQTHTAESAPEDPYVALARASLTQYITTGKELPLPKGLPAEMTGRRAGAFVSLHKGGDLRGCIGTIAPTTPSVAEEIVQNAVSAATQDPRFAPVAPEELPLLTISVDVLGEAEPVDSLEALDVKRYGVIVSAGGRRGLLLPDLEGVDSPAQQVDIARQKAGIPAGTPLRLERFEVVRHENRH